VIAPAGAAWSKSLPRSGPALSLPPAADRGASCRGRWRSPDVLVRLAPESCSRRADHGDHFGFQWYCSSSADSGLPRFPRHSAAPDRAPDLVKRMAALGRPPPFPSGARYCARRRRCGAREAAFDPTMGSEGCPAADYELHFHVEVLAKRRVFSHNRLRRRGWRDSRFQKDGHPKVPARKASQGSLNIREAPISVVGLLAVIGEIEPFLRSSLARRPMVTSGSAGSRRHAARPDQSDDDVPQ